MSDQIITAAIETPPKDKPRESGVSRFIRDFTKRVCAYWKRLSRFEKAALTIYIVLLAADIACSIYSSLADKVPFFLSYQRSQYPDTLINLSISWLSMFAIIQIILGDAVKHHEVKHKPTIVQSCIVVSIPLLSIIAYAHERDIWLSFLTFAQVLTVIYLFIKYVHLKSIDIELERDLDEYRSAYNLDKQREIFAKRNSRDWFSLVLAADFSLKAEAVRDRGRNKVVLPGKINERPRGKLTESYEETFEQFLSVLFKHPITDDLSTTYQNFIVGLLGELLDNISNGSNRLLVIFMKCLEKHPNKLVYSSGWIIIALAIQRANVQQIKYICGIFDDPGDASITINARETFIRLVSSVDEDIDFQLFSVCLSEKLKAQFCSLKTEIRNLSAQYSIKESTEKSNRIANIRDTITSILST